MISLKPQDVVIAAALLTLPRDWTYPVLAARAFIHENHARASVRRLTAASLFSPLSRRVHQRNFLLFAVDGLRFAFIAQRGARSKGVPTAADAPPLRDYFFNGDASPLVWPYPDGVEGDALTPLSPTVPQAALHCAALYEYLVLLDALRIGRVREKKIATQLLQERLENNNEQFGELKVP